MGVRDGEDLEDALDAAVLAEGTVQRIEGDIGHEPGEHLGNVALNVDAGDAVAGRFSRIGARIARGERHRPLARPTTHENGDMFRHARPRSDAVCAAIVTLEGKWLTNVNQTVAAGPIFEEPARHALKFTDVNGDHDRSKAAEIPGTLDGPARPVLYVSSCRGHVGVPEINPLEEERLAASLCQGICKAV